MPSILQQGTASRTDASDDIPNTPVDEQDSAEVPPDVEEDSDREDVPASQTLQLNPYVQRKTKSKPYKSQVPIRGNPSSTKLPRRSSWMAELESMTEAKLHRITC